jgi:hypothetical protein
MAALRVSFEVVKIGTFTGGRCCGRGIRGVPLA